MGPGVTACYFKGRAANLRDEVASSNSPRPARIRTTRPPRASTRSAPTMVPGAQSAPLTRTSGLQRCHDLVRRVFVEDHDGVHTCQRRHDFGALIRAVDRPPIPLGQGTRRTVGVDGHDQDIAQATRLLQITHVAGMEQIEHAIGEDNRPPRARRALFAALGHAISATRSTGSLEPDVRRELPAVFGPVDAHVLGARLHAEGVEQPMVVVRIAVELVRRDVDLVGAFHQVETGDAKRISPSPLISAGSSSSMLVLVP